MCRSMRVMTDIAIFVPSMHGGGAERVMMTLANEFVKRGFKVDLVLAEATGPFLNSLHRDVRVVDLGAGRVLKALFPLARYLIRERPRSLLSAMVHANVVAVFANFIAGRKTRVIVSQRNMLSIEGENSTNWIRRGLRQLIPVAYKKADGICSVSDGVSEDLAISLKIDRSRVRTIYNPFDLTYIDQNSTITPSIGAAWLDDPDIPVILGVGRLERQKDFETLIRAFSLVRRERKIRLIILGEGSERSSLELLAENLGLSEDDFMMPGFVGNPHSYMSRCDLFVLSSRFEGLPGVLIEALACGAPVISTDCPSGPAEILQKGTWGKLIPVGDPVFLADQITEVLEMDDAALPKVRDRALDFGIERSVDLYLKLLRLR